MSRYKIIIQYDGSKYYGWQLQPNVITIQGVLETGIRKVFRNNDKLNLYGSGRTDSGVHAWGQVAHVDLATRLNVKDMKNALNANIPDDCRIIAIEKVEKNFHARYSALKRYYRYQCYTGNSILYRNQSWELPKLNIDCLNNLSEQLIGTHDFLSFCKYRAELINTVCEIFHSRWSFEDNMIIFKISANRFLHHMIRYLVGTMVAVYNGRFKEHEFLSLLKNPRKNVKIFKAPPQGLILEKIDYV